MILELGKNINLIGKIDNINQGDSWANLTLMLEDGTKQNVKIDINTVVNYSLNKLYYFKTVVKEREEKLFLYVLESKIIYDYIKNPDRLEKILKTFYYYAPVEMKEIKCSIEKYIKEITNDNISKIVNSIYSEHENDFYLFPAATKFHHAYIGGLAYHTKTMIDIALPFINAYPYLNKDLLIAGILLHDMGKLKELSEAIGAEYTVRGHLLGHLVIESNEVLEHALKLNIQDTEEVLLLSHMILSSHGTPNFGAARKPLIPEAILLWYMDTIDSKFTVLGEEFSKTGDNEFTSPIGVLDKQKMYKHKIV